MDDRADEAGESIRDLLEEAARRLTEAGIDSPRRNAEWMFCDALSVTRASLYADGETFMEEAARRRVQDMLRRRVRREPLQYILGHTEFFGLHLQVTPDVLIPRPETEEVVEAALRWLEGRQAPHVLDVGTGSGCISLAIKKARPDAVVVACDVSSAALEIAGRNAVRNDLDIRLVEADVLDSAFESRVERGLDLLISNPPYVGEEEMETLPKEVRDHEPHLALFAREDPLRFYRRITQVGSSLVAPGGHLVLEVHADRARNVAALLTEDGGFERVQVDEDLFGRQRIVSARRSVISRPARETDRR